MHKEILDHIDQLEKEQEIKILFAAESGSRAWGCPSPDSDYDVRIIYTRPKSHYLEIDERADTIDYFHGKLLDINGWDIKKTFRLIRKSNATPFEWTQSPIIYKEVEGVRQKILDLCKLYFQPYHSVNHYKGIAKNSYLTNDLKSEIKLKKLFYVLRPLMAAKWIIEKNEIPPMDIPNLIKIIPNKDIVNHINELLKLKETVNEDYLHQINPLISDYIDNQFNLIHSVEIKKVKIPSNSDILNQTFKDLIDV